MFKNRAGLLLNRARMFNNRPGLLLNNGRMLKKRAGPEEAVHSALRLMGTALNSVIDTLGKGQPPDPRVQDQIAQANQIFNQARGYTGRPFRR